MKFTNITLHLLFTLLFFSCSQTLDFDQINDYDSSSVFSMALVSFDVDSNNFVTPVGEPTITEVSTISSFEIFKNNFIRKKLVKLGFDFEIRNEINRDFTIEMSLLNNNNTVVYQVDDLKIKANNLDFKYDYLIDVNQHTIVKDFKKIQIKIILDNSSIPLLVSDSGDVAFKSAITIYLNNAI